MNKTQLFFEWIDNTDPDKMIISVLAVVFGFIIIYIFVSSFHNARKIKKQKNQTVNTIRLQHDAVGRRIKR